MGTGGRGYGDPREGGVPQMLSGRAATLGLLALSVVLAVALMASLAGWQRDRAALNGRIADLSEQNERAQAVWKAQLSACQAMTAPRHVTRASAGVPGDDATRRLLAQGPEGIDGCARMESADQAVLSTLK